jgi:hypothetical protein
VLAPILEAYPSDIARDEIAIGAGYEPTSGGFANLLGVLRTMGMIDYLSSGRVKAEDILFPTDHA